MNPFESLSDENHDQIKKYLRFFAQKKEGLLRTINIEFADAKADKLNGSMYSRDDVEDFCEFLATAVKNNVSAEVGVLINMGALAVSQLLENAQDKGVEIALETAAVENQSLLQAIEKMGLESLPPSARRNVGAISSFKDDVKASKEESSRLEKRNNMLQDESRGLEKKNSQLQDETRGLEKKNSQLQDEVEALKRRLAQTERQVTEMKYDNEASEGKRNEESSSSAAEREKIKKLENALADCREEGERRVADTPQFKQMRQLMQTQSTNIRDLRRRLEKYEPDSVHDDEDS